VIGVLRFTFLLALAVWIGEVVFFSFGVAPALFQTLGPVAAGAAVGVIFPRYYAFGMASGALALVTAAVLAWRAASGWWWRLATLGIAIGLGATVYAGTVVHARARQAREGAAPSSPPSEEFARAHRLAVTLNGVALLGSIAALACSAAALRD
jgi:Domain of unknown function (DUF4149)